MPQAGIPFYFSITRSGGIAKIFIYFCGDLYLYISRPIMIFLSDLQGFLTSLDIWDIGYILLLAVFLGIEVISHVPAILHTPLMSGANAIHGVVIIGSIIVMGHASPDNYLALGLGFLAVVLGTLNVVGGFVVTNRMLQMFKKKK
jgi:NAD(P) transhydrogenase subunit alpha